jgi:SAM-dependent MidA family methyltransferase
LSAHVNFPALVDAANSSGARAYGPETQGDFLRRLGIAERAEHLSRNARDDATTALHRLVAPDQMGTLFKAMAILPKNAPPPPGFA